MAVQLINDFPQGSEAWHEFRKGKITGTSAWKLLAGQSPEDIIKESEQESTFGGNEYTKRGHVLEDEARKVYAEINGVEVSEVGVIVNDKYPNCSSSPDGLVGEDGGLEIKSFLPEHMDDVWKHLDNHIVAQIQFNLFISERQFWDLVLFNPDLPPKEAYKTKRFYPDQEIFSKFRQALNSLDDACVTETGLTLIKLEQELQARDEALKAQLQIREALNQQIAQIKQQLKDSTTGKVSKTIQMGEDKLSVSIYDVIKIDVEDESKVAEEYTLEVPLTNVVQHEDGTFYQRVPNPKLVQNLVKVGKALPEGFIQKNTRTIRLKFNGKAI